MRTKTSRSSTSPCTSSAIPTAPATPTWWTGLWTPQGKGGIPALRGQPFRPALCNRLEPGHRGAGAGGKDLCGPARRHGPGAGRFAAQAIPLHRRPAACRRGRTPPISSRTRPKTRCVSSAGPAEGRKEIGHRREGVGGTGQALAVPRSSLFTGPTPPDQGAPGISRLPAGWGIKSTATRS